MQTAEYTTVLKDAIADDFAGAVFLLVRLAQRCSIDDGDSDGSISKVRRELGEVLLYAAKKGHSEIIRFIVENKLADSVQVRNAAQGFLLFGHIGLLQPECF